MSSSISQHSFLMPPTPREPTFASTGHATPITTPIIWQTRVSTTIASSIFTPDSIHSFGGGVVRMERDSIKMEGSNITDEDLEKVSHNRQLKEIQLLECRHITIEGIRHIAGLPLLESLDLAGCYNLGIETIRIIAKIPELKTLRCTSNSEINGDYIEAFTRCPKLERLVVAAPSITNEAAYSLIALKTSANLQLESCANLREEVIDLLKFSKVIEEPDDFPSEELPTEEFSLRSP